MTNLADLADLAVIADSGLVPNYALIEEISSGTLYIYCSTVRAKGDFQFCFNKCFTAFGLVWYVKQNSVFSNRNPGNSTFTLKFNK